MVKDVLPKSLRILYGPMNFGSSLRANPLGKEMFFVDR